MFQGKTGPGWRFRIGLWALALLLGIAVTFGWEQVETQSAPSLMPVFSLPAGTYEGNQSLEIQVSHPEAAIFFTLDGRIPDPSTGTRYTHPLRFTTADAAVVVIRARVVLPDGELGPVASATYFLGIDASLPLMSLIVEPDDFWGAEQGIYVNHVRRGRAWERPVAVTYVDTDRRTGFHVGAGIRIHGGWSRYFFDKKSLRLYFRREYGPGLLAYPLFGEEEQTEFDRLILHNSGKDLLLFKNQLVERLSRQMGGYAARSRPVLLFINGRPWGIYQLRERVDDRFLQQAYGIEQADLSDTPNNRGMQSAEQLAVDTVHWEHFMAFVAEHDLSDPENYAYVQSQIDLTNFVDYYLLQMYSANTDWPHHNVHQFRPRTQGGRWQWLVWDNDFSFGMASNQMVDHVLASSHPLGQRMSLFLNKLIENAHFRNLFLTRAADLLNTTLAPDPVIRYIDQLAAEIAPDIGYEIERWSISADWETAVAELRDFARRRPDIMRQHIVESLPTTGTARLTFDHKAGEAGWIVVNESPPQPLPWQGVYFLDTTIRLRAIPAPDYEFVGWQGPPALAGTSSSVVTMTVTADQTITPRFGRRPSARPRAGDVALTEFRADDEGTIEGDWFELRVVRQGGVDLRGWRLTDNDSLTADDEGSLIFTHDPLLARVPQAATILVVATETPSNSGHFTADGWQDGRLVLYVGNGRLNSSRDPWFNLSRDDNLALLAPGASDAWHDDVPVALISHSQAVTPASFGLPPHGQDVEH